jgi:hypothetical protein
MSKFRYLDEIKKLDPVKDHQRIVYVNNVYEYPWDTTRALEFALFRTYAAPGISKLLDSTGEFYQRPQKRYDDTSLMISELYENGYDSERGRTILRNMNQQHGRFNISNEDFLYVASTFVFEPPRWMEKFAWRPMCEQEKLGIFHFWRELAHRMNIKDFPDDYAEFERFNRDYERKYFVFSETNQRIGNATVDLMLGWFLPRFLFPLGRPFIYAMLDDSLLKAFGYKKPPAILRWLGSASLKLRSLLVRLLPARRKPAPYTAKYHPTYPRGYTLEQLGPPANTKEISGGTG